MPERIPRGADAWVTCLGVGDGHLSADRGHAAFLYRFGGTRLLVDCGEPAAQTLLRAGVRADELDAVFISHLHFDHVGGLFTLLQSRWLAPRRHPFLLHLPATGIAPIRGLMQAACLSGHPDPFPVSLQGLRPGRAVNIGPIKVRPMPSSHLRQLCGSGRLGRRFGHAFSFLLESGNRRVAHTADLGDMADLELLVRRPLDLLVCELSHVALGDVLGVLRGRAIRRVALVHLDAANWQRRRSILARARRELAPMHVTIPEDGVRIPL